MVRKVLLVGGVLSSLLYVIGIDVIAALRYPDYHNYADQMVSELIAAGAPTRTVIVWLFLPYNFLVFALAVGVWASAGGKTRYALHSCCASRIWRYQHGGAIAFSDGRARDREFAAGHPAHCRHDSDVDLHRGDDGVRGFRTWDAVPALLICDHGNCRCVWRLGRLLGSSHAGANTMVGPR
jgi:hypothetical protein